MPARRLQNVQHGVFVQSGKAGNGPDADALSQHRNDHCGLVGFNADALKRLALAERGSAARTLEALHGAVAVGITTGFFNLVTLAATTGHNALAFLDGFGYRDSESYRILSEGFGLWMRSAGASTLADLLFLPLKL
jgi:hypothetical protein